MIKTKGGEAKSTEIFETQTQKKLWERKGQGRISHENWIQEMAHKADEKVGKHSKMKRLADNGLAWKVSKAYPPHTNWGQERKRPSETSGEGQQACRVGPSYDLCCGSRGGLRKGSRAGGADKEIGKSETARQRAKGQSLLVVTKGKSR